MQYTRLRSFHAVATAGGFNAAAAAFNISQPTLSAQVGALEDEYGLELFVKKGRRRELSDSGRQLLAITTRLFAEEDEAAPERDRAYPNQGQPPGAREALHLSRR